MEFQIDHQRQALLFGHLLFPLEQEDLLFPGFAFLYHKREMWLISNGARMPFYAYHELTLIRLEKQLATFFSSLAIQSEQ